MSSRREEKEQRRAERIAAEEAAARAERRRRGVGIAAGAVLGIAAVVAVVIVFAAGGGKGGSSGTSGPATTAAPKVPIPAAQATDLATAAKAAGCQLRSFVPGPNDRGHVTHPVHYKQNPPVFGQHNPVWAPDGDYAGRTPPEIEMLVHALEHGRVIIWYRPAIGQHRIQQLETLLSQPYNDQPAGYKQLLVAHPSMPFPVAATAWGHQLGCSQFTDRTFDALRAFRSTYVDKGPESIPFPE